MRVYFVVHGIVQGVGYRNFVRGIALRHGVNGVVRNHESGSVEILADADAERLSRFEDEINVSTKYGPQVMRMEKHTDSKDFPKDILLKGRGGFFILGTKRSS